eukprot:6152323-Pyramimonas_sp.AAC.1
MEQDVATVQLLANLIGDTANFELLKSAVMVLTSDVHTGENDNHVCNCRQTAGSHTIYFVNLFIILITERPTYTTYGAYPPQ